jgi:GT2 family glycosyltransferase
MSATLSIVIPTWNGRNLVAECLASLRQQTTRGHEIIVVDDGSTDDTCAFLAKEYPDVRVVRLETNSGFCVAVNAGIRAGTGDLIMLLNNDMTLAPDCLEKLLLATEMSDAALFAPLVLFREEPDVVYSAGDCQRANGRPESIGFRCKRDTFELPARIFGVSAGAGLYRREVFERAGVLEERFVAYFEDSDLNLRARLAGFDAQLAPDAVAYHVGSASLGGKTWWRSRQCWRNHALLVIRNYPMSLLARFSVAIMKERVHQTRRLISSARAEFGLIRALGVWCGAWVSLWAAIPSSLAARARIQSSRRIAPRALEELMTK